MTSEAKLIDRRVYIIDDDEAVRATLRRTLTGAGIYSEEFGTAGEFLEAQPDLQIGCILLDLRLPEMNGLELLRALKQRGVPDPVVMISGQADVSCSNPQSRPEPAVVRSGLGLASKR